ncbi:MAG: hypothetical protein ACKVHR_08215 [Pirellulales bacterium]|jgi:hypothetical protein
MNLIDWQMFAIGRNRYPRILAFVEDNRKRGGLFVLLRRLLLSEAWREIPVNVYAFDGVKF